VYAISSIAYFLLGFLLRDEVVKAGHLFIGAGFFFFLISIEFCCAWMTLRRENPAS
jgi:hypothetical protein